MSLLLKIKNDFFFFGGTIDESGCAGLNIINNNPNSRPPKLYNTYHQRLVEKIPTMKWKTPTQKTINNDIAVANKNRNNIVLATKLYIFSI